MMEVFSGAVENTDFQIGRVIAEAIDQLDDLDNTLIIYVIGDNGPTPEGGKHGVMNKLTYTNGVPESLDEVRNIWKNSAARTPWAAFLLPGPSPQAGPYSYGKMVTSGGGCSTAVAVSWPARIRDSGRYAPAVHPSR